MNFRVTTEGQRKIEAWHGAMVHQTRCARELKSAQDTVKHWEGDLGKWMCPADAKPGESFSIWFGDALIEVTKNKNLTRPYTIKLRRRHETFCDLSIVPKGT